MTFNELCSRAWVRIVRSFRVLPMSVRWGLARCAAALFWIAVPKRRHVILTNLRLCFPEMSEGERRTLARRVYVRLARAARDALLASTEDDVTISALAQELGASSSQLAASFRGVYGMTPAAFLRAQKMHSAAQLLRTSDRTVLDIAGQFGYDNASKFAKAFRSVIGVSPSAYRAGADSDSCAPTAEKAE